MRRKKMKKFKVTLARTEYLYQDVMVEADTPEEAQEMAWDRSGQWESICNAEEFVNDIVCIKGE
jgi:hypothetical protein